MAIVLKVADMLHGVPSTFDYSEEALVRIMKVAHRGDYTAQQFEALRLDALARAESAKTPYIAEMELDFARQHEIQRDEAERIVGSRPSLRLSLKLRAEAERLGRAADEFARLESAYG